MKILSIETSCDDTGITIFEAKANGSSGRSASFKILANIVSSQRIHAQYGGVFPMMAKKEHIKNLPIVLELAIKKARLNKEKIPVDAIALTYGPGLEPCLWSGIVFAKELVEKWSNKLHPSNDLKNKKQIPLIPVNHMEGHILSVFTKPKGKFSISLPKSSFPMLSLLVSGGHTELVLIKDIGKYEIIGKTLDDAAGEAYDKVARMLGLEYPGGPKISRLAEEKRQEISKNKTPSFTFPRPMLKSPNLDFSFAGLKTSVLYAIQKLGENRLNDDIKKTIAMEFENAVIDTLIYKTSKAVEKYKAKKIIIAGGVSANKHLQRQIKKAFSKEKVLFPPKELTGDNALMIGVAGYLGYIRNKKKVPSIKNLKAEGNLSLCKISI